MKPCFESAKCLTVLQSTTLPTALNALEAGEMSEGNVEGVFAAVRRSRAGIACSGLETEPPT